MKKEIIILLFICPIVCFYTFSHHMRSPKKKLHTQITLEDSFERLEGSEMEEWSYIQTSRDFQDLARYKMLYKKNYNHQFNCNAIFKIPRTIHFIWIGPQPFPSESVENIRSWIAHHPDWTFKFWTDRYHPSPCNKMQIQLLDEFSFQFLKDKFEESNSWKEKSNLWRYEILYQEGGLYVDHDTCCTRPFHSLHTGYDFYAALELPHEAIDSLALSAGIGVIGVKPYHPVLYETIAEVLSKWDEASNRFTTSAPRIQHRTFISMTHALQRGLNHPDNIDIIFPASYFYPKKALPGFYSKHLYATYYHDDLNTKSPREQLIYQEMNHIHNRDEKIIRLELINLCFVIGSFFLYYLTNKEIKSKTTS